MMTSKGEQQREVVLLSLMRLRFTGKMQPAPLGVSDARWNAMHKHLYREFDLANAEVVTTEVSRPES